MAKQGGTTQSTNTVNTGPWQPQQQYLTDVFGKAQGLYGQNVNNKYYGGETVAPFTPGQTDALTGILGMPNSPNVAAANTQNLSTINGDYLNSNPYIDKTFDMAAAPVTRAYQTATAPQTAGAMASAGRYGSGAYQNLVKGNELGLGTTLDNLATSIYGGNYANERQLQQGATGMAPALDTAQYIDPTAKLSAGGQQQQQQQAVDTSNMAAYNYNRDQPTNALNTYLGQVSGNYGQSGTTTQQTPYYTNPVATGIGGLLGLGSLFTPGAGGTSAAGNLGSGLGSLLPAAAGLFAKSDRRLKTDVLRVARVDGVNVYSFRFKNSPKLHVGPMAQEVAEIKPQAVIRDLDGYLMVDYAAVFKRAA